MAGVVVVGDEPAAAELVRRLLERAGHDTTIPAGREVAVGVVLVDRPDCVVLDLVEGGIGDNLSVLESLRAHHDRRSRRRERC